MILPFLGLIAGIGFSVLLGLIVISLHPKLKVTFQNLALFALGCVISSGTIAFIYPKIFPDSSTVIILGFLLTIFLFAVFGGLIGILIGNKIIKDFE